MKKYCLRVALGFEPTGPLFLCSRSQAEPPSRLLLPDLHRSPFVFNGLLVGRGRWARLT